MLVQAWLRIIESAVAEQSSPTMLRASGFTIYISHGAESKVLGSLRRRADLEVGVVTTEARIWR
jgi:hypothetical protein